LAEGQKPNTLWDDAPSANACFLKDRADSTRLPSASMEFGLNRGSLMRLFSPTKIRKFFITKKRQIQK
jgi:hypothetical protein